jgi:hypothetical protein
MPKSLLVVLAVVATLLVPHAARTVQAAQRCFPETGFCIDGRFREYWEQNGGLAVFGFPIGPEEQLVVDGKSVTSQRFERNRLELHPENKRPYDVLLGRLGADRLTQQGRDWFTFAKSSDTGKCRVFAETGHAVCGDILKSWRASGLQLDGKRSVSDAESLALFGMPLSGVVTETLSDGKEYQVQWFERARFELHPENPAPYNVLLGLLGNEVGYDESLNDRPLNEYSLQITDFPAGMTSVKYEFYSYKDAAANWDDPVSALANFERLGRVNSFASEFDRPLGVYTIDSGVDVIYLNVTNFRSSSGASEFLSLQMKEKVYTVNMNPIYFPITNVDESYANIGPCDGTNQRCKIINIFMRKGNICVRVYGGGYAAQIKMDSLQRYVQIIADRLNT